MSLVVNLNVPAGDGVGTAADTSGQAIEKTIAVGGSFTGSLVIEASMGGADFVPVATLTSATSKVIRVVATQMRVRRAATADAGAPVVDVIAEASAVAFQALEVPAGNGVGASADITSMKDEITALVTGDFDGAGALNIEVSADNTNWVSLGRTFAAPDVYTVRKPAKWARVRRAGVTYGGVPVVYLGSETVGATGVGGRLSSTLLTGTVNVYVDNDNGDDNNSGLDANDALQTLAAVFDKFPTSATSPGRIIVNFAAGNGSTQAVYDVPPIIGGNDSLFTTTYRFVGPDFIAFTPATGPSSATLDAGTPAQQADGNDAPSGSGRRCQLNFSTAAPGWTPDDFAGNALARITRGNDRVVYEMPISGNTADAIFIDEVDLIAQVQAGDLVEVVIPGARLEPAGSELLLSLIGQATPEFFFNEAATFQRLSLANMIMRGVFSFDRCQVRMFCYGGLPMFVNCFESTGDVMTGTSGIADVDPQTVPGGTDPLNTSVFVNKVTAGPNARYFFSPSKTAGAGVGGGGYHWVKNFSVRSTGAVNGEGLLQFSGGSFIQFFGDLILMCPAGGSGSFIEIEGNSFVKVPDRTASDLVAAPTNGITMLASGLSIPYTNGVGGFFEVAGYNGNFFDPPASPGDQGDFSNIRVI